MRHHLLFVFLLLLLFPLRLSAQERRLQHRPYIDNRPFHYGFFVGLHDQGIHLTNKDFIDPVSGAQWLAENNTQNFGFHVGILGDWKLTSYLSLRFTPSLYFGSKHFKFNNLLDGKTRSEDLKSCYVGLPLQTKFNAPRFNNYRPYVLLGVAPMYDLINKKQTLLRMKPFTAQLEVGLGCDLYLPFFKLIPELKFCFGLNNILDRKRSDLKEESDRIFTKSVESARTNMIVLTFYFE